MKHHPSESLVHLQEQTGADGIARYWYTHRRAPLQQNEDVGFVKNKSTSGNTYIISKVENSSLHWSTWFHNYGGFQTSSFFTSRGVRSCASTCQTIRRSAGPGSYTRNEGDS